MERTPAPAPPMKCFGLHQGPDNPLCPACNYRQECAEAMGHLANRVPLNQAKFDFGRSGIKKDIQDDQTHDSDPDLENIEVVYIFCHEWVFDFKPRNHIGRQKEAVMRQVHEASTSIKMFFLANMLSWKKSKGNSFAVNYLTSDFAAAQVKKFAALCHKMYGTFDTTSLDHLVGSSIAPKDIEANMLRSEIIAGSWIVAFKLIKAGDIVEKFYNENEQAMDPNWLAIEETYFVNVLNPHLQHPERSTNPVLRKVRWNTAHVMGRLKLEPRQAAAVFCLREKIMPSAIEHVIGLYGYHPNDFLISQTTVNRPFKFWANVAVVIQHMECLNFIEGSISIFDKFKSNGI